MLSAIRCSPALPIPPASRRRSNHFISTASALFQQKRFYATFVFNTLRTLCIVKLPLNPAPSIACALFAQKWGCIYHPIPFFGLSAEVDEESPCRRSIDAGPGREATHLSSGNYPSAKRRFRPSGAPTTPVQKVAITCNPLPKPRISLQKTAIPRPALHACLSVRTFGRFDLYRGLFHSKCVKCVIFPRPSTPTRQDGAVATLTNMLTFIHLQATKQVLTPAPFGAQNANICAGVGSRIQVLP